MKNFLIIYNEAQKHLLNDTLVQAHKRFLNDLSTHGYLRVCGPFKDTDCTMLCLMADSEQHARELLQTDPYLQTQYYKSYTIQEFTATSVNPVKQPDFLFVTQRKLKDNTSYADFYQAWQTPNNYVNAPVRVFNAQNVSNQAEIISVGLIWASAEDIHTESQRLAEAEKIRAQKIATVADKLAEAKVYMVRDENILGL